MGTPTFVVFESWPEFIDVAIALENVVRIHPDSGAGAPRCVVYTNDGFSTVVIGTFGAVLSKFSNV